MLVVACRAPISAAAEQPPNIVYILADDLGYAELGCYGQTKIKTPNIDRMAAEGMRFTQHYCGNAVCAPSRCVLMTGKHPGHAYVRGNRSTKLPKTIREEYGLEFPGQQPVRMGKWKGVRQGLRRRNNPDPLKIELYNLEEDISETH
ncbi:MAG: sulfatase-like hydrolase/transferase, partial [Pirellulaceae bacterium]